LEPLCKGCAQFVDEESFSFLKSIPAELGHSVYCGPCFDQQVAPEMAKYQEILDRAKDILVYEKTQGKETRYIKRLADPVLVADCADHDETILRLAFFAAKENYNALVDVDLRSKKVKVGGYQTTIWSGSGVPAQVDASRLVKDRSIWQNPN